MVIDRRQRHEVIIEGERVAVCQFHPDIESDRPLMEQSWHSEGDCVGVRAPGAATAPPAVSFPNPAVTVELAPTVTDRNTTATDDVCPPPWA
jgi:hypothetical protein